MSHQQSDHCFTTIWSLQNHLFTPNVPHLPPQCFAHERNHLGSRRRQIFLPLSKEESKMLIPLVIFQISISRALPTAQPDNSHVQLPAKIASSANAAYRLSLFFKTGSGYRHPLGYKHPQGQFWKSTTAIAH